MPDLMSKSEAITTFLCRILLWIKTLVYDNSGFVKDYRAQYVGFMTEAGAGHSEEAIGIIEVDVQLEMLFDNAFDRDGWGDLRAARVRKLTKQNHRIALDLLLGKVGHWPGHLSSIF